MQVAEGDSKQLQALQAEADQELKCQREQLQLKANAELQTLVKVRRGRQLHQRSLMGADATWMACLVVFKSASLVLKTTTSSH